MADFPIITSTNITKIKQIGPSFKGIFLVTVSGTSIVIKREQTDNTSSVAHSNMWANKLMRRATDGGSVLKIENMSKTEIAAFLTYLNKKEVQQQLKDDKSDQGKKDDLVYVINGMQQDGTTALYVKLPFNSKLAKGTDLTKGAALTNAENYVIWYKAVDKSSFWKELGKIAAIDHFNSNFDRIDFGNGFGGDVWEVSNPGNMIIYAGKPLPIDAWNSGRYMTAESDYTQTLSPKVKLGLDVMKDPAKTLSFINEVTKSILKFMKKMAPLDGHLHDEETIKQKYSKVFMQGYNEGVRKIKEVMLQKVARYGGDALKKSRNPFAAKKEVVPSGNAIFNAKYGAAAGVKTMQGGNSPAQPTIPWGMILRMEYLDWV